MVHTCCVVGCTNRRGKDDDVAFHKFPWADEDRARQWISNISRQTVDGKPWTPSKHDRVCSKHFVDSDYQLHTKKKKLVPNAIPSIFPHNPKHKRIAITPQRPLPTKRSHDTSTEAPVNKLRKEDILKLKCHDHPYAKESMESDLEKQAEKNRVLTEKFTQAKKELKVLKTKVKRKAKKIEDLFAEIKEKHMIDIDSLELLTSNLSEASKMLFNNEIQQGSTAAHGRRYSEEVKSFAVTLHFYSAQAYEFLRKFLTLPDVSTIRRWSSSIGCEPGFLSDALDHIALKKQSNPEMADICIMFDSMAVKKEIVFDDKTGKYSGCVDFGSSSDCADHLATEALVVMAVGLRTHWKQPIAYFLVDKICARMQSQIVRDAICHLTEREFLVHATICDGSFANQKTAVELGCNLNADNLNTAFPHPSVEGETIFFLFDACHLLKNIRNCFGEYGVLLDGDGLQIKWTFVKNLHEEQLKDNLFLANKLSSRHIDFAKNKMNVKLAAQTLSTSVADAIDYLREDKRISSFQGSEATCRFIRTIDKLFDICNSRSPIGKYSKAPISLKNLSEKLTDLELIDLYIRGLTDIKKNKMTTGRRKTAFIGFLVTIKSITLLSQRLLHKAAPFKYILTYKLSQDNLETLFSRIRRRGGWNNNPTCAQFKYALRACMMKNGIRPSSKANCIEVEEPEITISTDNASTVTTENVTVPAEIGQFVELMKHRSYMHDDILFYLAGYICRQLIAKFKCSTCLEAIGKRASSVPDLQANPFAKLTLRKDRGGLLASNDIFKIVLEADRAMQRLVTANSFPTLSAKVIMAVQVAVCEKIRHNIFQDLSDHVRDTLTPLEDDHITQIIKLVCHRFTTMVFRRNAKVINERFVRNCQATVRHKLTKTILFLHI